MNYKTQMDAAKKGILTKEMKTVAQKEFMDETKLMELVASGRVAIPANIRHWRRTKNKNQCKFRNFR